MPTRAEVIANIDETIRDKNSSDKILNTEDADNRELILDYIDQEVAAKVSPDDLGATAFSNDYDDLDNKPDLSAKQDVSNLSTDVETDGASDTKYPSVKAVKDYVDANAGGICTTIVGLLSYNGTDFTYTSILNQTVATISWIKFGGVIYGTMSSSILTDKTVVEDRNLTVDGGYLIQCRRASVTSFELAFVSTAGLTSSVPNFTNLPIKIEIYN